MQRERERETEGGEKSFIGDLFLGWGENIFKSSLE